MRLSRSTAPSRRRSGRSARHRLLAVAAAGLCASAVLAACGGTGSSAGSAGSATSGAITWWGWTPTVQGAASYIKAFNKVYPHIHVTFK